MGAGFAVGTFIGWAMQIGVSHLSGFWWLVGGAAAYIAFCLFMFSNFQVAGSSDRDIAEMGGPR